MGEVAEMMLDGTLCEGCGVYLGENMGYPQRCSACQITKIDNRAKTHCPCCGKVIKSVGLKQHIEAKHESHLEK